MAEQNNTIKTTVVLDATQAQQEIIRLNAKASDTTKTLKERITAKNKQIKIQNQLSKGTLDGLKKEVTSLKKLGKSEKVVEGATKRLNKTRIRATRISANNIKQLNRLNVVSKKSSRVLGGLSTRFLGWTAVIFGAFRALKSMLGLVTEFEAKNKELSAILQLPIDKISDLSDNAEYLGGVTAKTALEVTKLQIAYARLGFTQDEILNLTKATIDGSIAMNSELNRTANLVGAVVRSFDSLESIDAPHIIDVLALATAKSALNFEKLETALPIVAGAANALDIPLETVVATLGKLSDSGIVATTSATALRNIYIESAKRGINYKDALFEIANSTNKLTKANELFGKRAAVSALIIANNTEGLASLSEELKKAKDIAQEMANKQLVSIAGKTTLLSSAWSGLVLAIDNGNGPFSTAIKNILDLTTSFLKAINPTKLLSEKTEEQRVSLLELESKIKDVNTSEEDRLALIDQFKIDYPGYLDNLDTDKITNQELANAILLVNDQLYKKILLQKEDEKIAKQAEETASAADNASELRIRLRQRIAEIAVENGLKIKDNATLEEQANDILKKSSELADEKSGKISILGEKVRFLRQNILNLRDADIALNEEIVKGNKLRDHKIAKAEELDIHIETEIEKTARLAAEKKKKDKDAKASLIETILLTDKSRKADDLKNKSLEQLNEILTIIAKKEEDDAKAAEIRRKKIETQKRRDSKTAEKIELKTQDAITLAAIKGEEDRAIKTSEIKLKNKKSEIDKLLISEKDKTDLKNLLTEKSEKEIEDIKLKFRNQSIETQFKTDQLELDSRRKKGEDVLQLQLDLFERERAQALKNASLTQEQKDLIEEQIRQKKAKVKEDDLIRKQDEATKDLEVQLEIDQIDIDRRRRNGEVVIELELAQLNKRRQSEIDNAIALGESTVEIKKKYDREENRLREISKKVSKRNIDDQAKQGLAAAADAFGIAQELAIAQMIMKAPKSIGDSFAQATEAYAPPMAQIMGAMGAAATIIPIIKGLNDIKKVRFPGSRRPRNGGGSVQAIASESKLTISPESIDNIATNNAARLGIDPNISGNATSDAANNVMGDTQNNIVFSESSYQNFQNQVNFKEEKTSI